MENCDAPKADLAMRLSEAEHIQSLVAGAPPQVSTARLGGTVLSHDVLIELAARYQLRSLVEAIVVRTGKRTDRVRLSLVAERCAAALKKPTGTLWCGKVRRAMRDLGWSADIVHHHNVPLLKGAKLR